MSKYTILIYDEKNPRSFTYNLTKYFNLILLSGKYLNTLNTLRNKIAFLTKIIKHYKIKLIHFHGISFENILALYLASKKCEIPVLATLHTYKLVCPILYYLNLPETKPCKNPYPQRHCLKCLISYYKLKQVVPERSSLYRSAGGLLLLEVYREIYKNLDLIITPSRLLAKILRSKRIGVKNIIILRNPIRSLFERYRRSQRIEPANPQNIGFIGRLEFLKGISIALLVAKKLKSRGIRLYVVGDGAYRDIVKKWSHIHSNISYLGFLKGEKLIDFYKKSRIILVPSITHECFPNVVLEALAVGRPIVGFALGGVKEIVEESGAGLLARPIDIINFEEHINKLLEDQKLWWKLVLKGKIWIQNNIPSTKTYTQHLIKMYEMLM